MKTECVQFTRAKCGWVCEIVYRFTSAEQFTDVTEVARADCRWWLSSYFEACKRAKLHIAVFGAKRGEREAKGWAA